MSSQPYPNPQAIFYQQYEAVRRDEVVGILLALFLGGFGIHHFYLRRIGPGDSLPVLLLDADSVGSGLYRVLLHARPRAGVQRHPGGGDCGDRWGLPMPGWGQPFNVTVNVPPAPQPGTLQACGRCSQTNPPGSRFCSACGAPL